MTGKERKTGLQKVRRGRPGCWIGLLLIAGYVVYHIATPDRDIPVAEEQARTNAANAEPQYYCGEPAESESGAASRSWRVDDVPNPRQYDARNRVGNPDGILSPDAERTINSVLQQLEDSLSVEVAVVALNSIGGEAPRDFAHRLFNTWGIGKAEDDNGLLVLLTLNLRDITFETGYGLESVLPDAICKRIQTGTMVPYLAADDWDKGMTEGVKAIAATLYGSGYEAVPPEAWITKFRRTTPALVFAVFGVLLLLMNWLTWKSVVSRLRPKSGTTEAALSLLATRNPLTLRTLFGVVWLVPVWPAVIAAAVWYWGGERRRTLRRSRTCPKCGKERLVPVPEAEAMRSGGQLSDCERKELELGTAYIRIYRCTTCGEMVKLRIPLEKEGYEYCPACHGITLQKSEKYRTVEKPTASSEGLREARHECLCCGAKYIVGYAIPKISTSSGGSGSPGGRGGGGGGSFGGGSSGGGGSSSRF